MRERGAGKQPSDERQPPRRAVTPGAPDPVRRMLALQRSAGNAAVARAVEAERHPHGPGRGHGTTVARSAAEAAEAAEPHRHGAGCGHGGAGDTGPQGQRGLIDAAMSTPSRTLPEPFLDRAKAFYRNDGLSEGRVHDNPTAQRATAALGAEAMTVGNHIFLGPSAVGNTRILAHEASHLDKNLRGVRETGNDNGAGVTVTDPRQASEVSAVADGDAFEAGATTAPSVAAQRSVRSGADDGPAAVQRAGGSGRSAGKVKEKSARQIAKGIDEEVKQEWDYAYGGGRQGTAPEEVRMRYARSMADDRTSQALSHQSFLVYDAIQARREQTGKKAVNEREVQGMLINNRLLFASNFNESMDLLKPFETSGSRDTYPSLVGTHQSDAGRVSGLPASDADEYRNRLNRADVKTQAMLAGQRDDAVAEALRERRGKPVTVIDVDDPRLHLMLTGKQYEGAVFFVKVPAEKGLMHAEQKLLLALRTSGITGEETKGSPHAVMGRYRGCLCCTAALDYYRNELGFSTMDYDPNPGFYYWESLENLYKHQDHVVKDPKFRETMLRLARELPSTPAMSRTEPPEHAYERNGPESLEHASAAARRNYRSPSTSDVETGFDAETGLPVYTSYERELDLGYAGGTGGAKVGKGTKIDDASKSKSRARATRIVDAAGWTEIQNSWLNDGPEEQARVYRKWEKDKKASRAELVEIIRGVETERSAEAVHAAVSRLVKGTTGHERRDNRKAGDPVVRRPDKGKYAEKPKSASKKPTRKTGREMKRKSKGWKKIEALMKAERNTSDFYKQWRVEDAKSKPGNLKTSLMSPALAQLVADLGATYTVSTMSHRLHIAERTLRRFVSERRPAQAAEPDSDTASESGSDTASVAGDTASVAATTVDDGASEYQGGDVMDYADQGDYADYGDYEEEYGGDDGGMDYEYADDYASDDGQAAPAFAYQQQGGSASGTAEAGPSHSFAYPGVSGYTLVVHRGQTLYRDDSDGQFHWRDPDTYRMVPLGEYASDVEMSDA
ncbi:DUF4157 domain-containing protein [Streptomyces zhihengii]|uniref:eCIS core domain-containing protein n=1 Tax=Streptomyces zhihengii TaxID=1818004 RepID=UPI0036297B3C